MSEAVVLSPAVVEADQQAELARIAAIQHNAYLAAKKTLVLSDFWEFCGEVLDYKNLQPFHNDLCQYMQNYMHKKRLVLLPRGHLKSTIVTVGYTLWRIAQDPGLRILISNATAPLAQAFLRQIKAHLQKNQRFIELFGDLFTSSEKWTDESVRFSQIRSLESKENSITAFGIGGNLVSQHYDLMIYDDLVNRENIHTPERIEEVHTFYKDAQDLVDDPMLTEQIMIGTRWHEGDLYGTIIDRDNPERNEWVVMKRDAVEGDYEIVKDDRGNLSIEGGHILYPSKFPNEALNKLLRSKGISNFSAQYLNDPIPADQSTFKHEFIYYEPEDVKGYEFNTFITVDPAFFDPANKGRDPDYTGIVVNKVPYTNDWYIWDLINQRLSPNELIDLLFELDKKYKPKTIGIESTSWQKILGYVAREQMRSRNQFLPITELKHSGVTAKSKFDRIQGLEPRYAVGSIFHNRNIRQMTTLEMQLRRFPRSKYDDLSDALASQLEIAVPPRRNNERRESNGNLLSYPA